MAVSQQETRTAMIDIQQLRKDIDTVAARLATRHFVLDVAKFNALEGERKHIQTRTEELQGKRNTLSPASADCARNAIDTSAAHSAISTMLHRDALRIKEIQKSSET